MTASRSSSHGTTNSGDNSTNKYSAVVSGSPNSSADSSVNGNDENENNSATTSSTLKEIVAQSCKPFDLGVAVLPKLLFYPDVDELAQLEEQAQLDKAQLYRDDAAAHKDTKTAQSIKLQMPPKDYVPRYAQVIDREFTAVVVEHHLKWAPMCVSEPGPLEGEKPCTRLGRYDFHHADAVVDWAIEHGKKVKGHVLVWSVTSPKFLEDMEPHQIREQLKRHIYTTIGHYRGRIKVWDVVNEALAPDGSMAENVFYRKLGPSYIEDAFRWAHEADPTAFLIYNDNKVEGYKSTDPKCVFSQKANAFYTLLYDLKVNKNVPIHGAGIQAHFNAAGTGRNRCPTPRMVKQQIRRLGDIGLKVNISEMDVRVSELLPNVQQIAQRQIYHDIICAALSEPAFDGIWLWGFTDRHTWVTHFYHDDEPLIFDEDYDRKESYFGLHEALATMTPGGIVGGGDKVPLTSDVDRDGNKWGYLWMNPEPKSNNKSSSPTKSAASSDEEDDDDSKDDGNDSDKSDGIEDIDELLAPGDDRPDWKQSSAQHDLVKRKNKYY